MPPGQIHAYRFAEILVELVSLEAVQGFGSKTECRRAAARRYHLRKTLRGFKVSQPTEFARAEREARALVVSSWKQSPAPGPQSALPREGSQARLTPARTRAIDLWSVESLAEHLGLSLAATRKRIQRLGIKHCLARVPLGGRGAPTKYYDPDDLAPLIGD